MAIKAIMMHTLGHFGYDDDIPGISITWKAKD